MKMELDVLSNEQGELLKKMTLEFGTVIQADPVTPVIEPLTVAENGEYSVPDGVDGFNPVKVNTPSGWQPQSDWWDIKAIFEADPDPNKRAIILLTDSLNTFVFDDVQLGNAGSYYKTSDGVSYIGNATHTFDKTKDKPCAMGYKTRWVMVYNQDPDIALNLSNATNNNAIYIYVGNSSILNLLKLGGTTPSTSNYILETIEFHNSVTTSANALATTPLYNCSSLVKIAIPQGATIIGSNAFNNCFILSDIQIPDSVTTLGLNTFTNCISLKELTLPDSITTFSQSSIYSCHGLTEFTIPKGFINPGMMGLANNYNLRKIKIPKEITNLANMFSNLISLLNIEIEDGWVAPSFSISGSNLFTENNAIVLFTKLGATQSPVTLTFGATLLNRWSQSTKDIAINKGYTLA